MSSRSRRPPATTTSAVTTGTSASSTGWSASSRTPTASTSAATRWPCSACARPPRRPRSSSPARLQTGINLPYITAGADGPLHLDESLSRAKFEELTADLLNRTKAPFAPGHQGRRDLGGRHRPGRHGRRLDAHARGLRRGARADQRQGAQQGRQPRRGRRARRQPAGRRAQGRGQGRPAARRDPAEPGHRDQGRDHDQAHRAQHHDPDQALGDLHHRRRQPALGADPGVPGRARDGGVQQEARHVRADRPAAGTARHPAGRGHVRHRRQRDRARVGQGPGHRPRSRR